MKKDNQNNSIIIYEGDDGQSHVEVRFEGETAWLSQAQLVDLYQSSKANVSEHIKNIFFDRELEENVVVRKIRTTTKHGATKFRIWATARLKEYIVKGFVMDDERLKGTGGGNYWKELLNEIRDIRSSEKVLYRQVLDLYATSVDYDPHSSESIAFLRWCKTNFITRPIGILLPK